MDLCIPPADDYWSYYLRGTHNYNEKVELFCRPTCQNKFYCTNHLFLTHRLLPYRLENKYILLLSAPIECFANPEIVYDEEMRNLNEKKAKVPSNITALVNIFYTRFAPEQEKHSFCAPLVKIARLYHMHHTVGLVIPERETRIKAFNNTSIPSDLAELHGPMR
ncbi:hypothetical protein BDQ12DRAFT_665045 [Crucibulum laeve]|uniref:Uncharacterized protein n=1 Tax=Crucibulum laeve TaxID=68775 RepID=A0A5C3M3N2_9AGAR|nr:hypothetical protein BDQ12DRAFT_665045 [Crucibulum laeve]